MPSWSEISDLIRNGDDLNEPPCADGEPCIGSYYRCEHLCSQLLDFGPAGKLPVYWCDDPGIYPTAGSVELMTEKEATHG